MNFDHDIGKISSILVVDTSVAPPIGGNTNSLSIVGTGALTVPVGTTGQQPTAGTGKIRYDSTTNQLMWSNSSTWTTLSTGGTITSVSLSDGSTSPIYTITGSPITTSGTLTFTLNTQTANKIFASPNGSTGQPNFRALVSADIPTLSYLPLTGGSMSSGANITLTGNGTVTGLPTPVNSSDAANKSYVDSVAAGLDPKQSVRLATTTALSGAVYNATGGSSTTGQFTSAPTTIDGVAISTGDRILVKNQVDQKQNGIYSVTAISTVWDRSADMDGTPASEVSGGNFVFVEGGTTNASTGWVTSGQGILTLNTNNIVWVQFSGSGTYSTSLPLTLTGNTFSLSALNSYGTANQIIGTNNGATGLEYKTVTQGTGITVAHGTNTITLTNAGVTSLALATADQTTGLYLGGATTGNLTLTIDSVLDAIANISTTGLLTRTGAGTASARTITGTTNTITVTNGDGAAGNPTLTIASDPVLPGTGAVSVVSGTTAQQPSAGAGKLRYDTTTNQLMWSNTTTWNTLSTGGTVTSVAFSTGTTGLSVTGSPITGSGTLTLSGTLNIANGGTGLATTPTDGQLLIGKTSTTNYTLAALTSGTGISVVNGSGSITINNTGVTSVGFADTSTTSIFTISGTPVTTTGTLSVVLKSQTAKQVFAAPNGSNGQPGFRALVQSDLSFLSLYNENTATGAVGSASTSVVADSRIGIALGQGAYSQTGLAFTNGVFSSAGDAQYHVYVLRNTTTTATPTVLYTDSTLGEVAARANSVNTFRATIAARRTDATGGGAGYVIDGVYMMDATASSIAMVGTPSIVVLGETSSAWDVSATVSTTSGALRITVTGEAAKTIRWVASIAVTEVTN